ncbi:hypothetical protein [Paenarthrobacter ureafaciens]|uniref:hypothetical protein n=1 Tax=Paenarthrobacter ureafaciens TaxID=37931 RepID=UPI0015BCF3BA|nr:hypothetical protein [Paenarthrobacter ureafaciens]
MTIPARTTMTVFWNAEEGQEEKRGFIVFGLVDPDRLPGKSFPVDMWPAGTEVAETRLHGESWEVKLWDVKISEFPHEPEWTEAVHATLKTVIDAGCRVAWVSSEGYPFVDPPHLFLAEGMSGSVFAALTSAGEFFCPLDPDQPIRAISDDHLALLREHARGLADAAS